jgi:hypothetical protein
MYLSIHLPTHLYNYLSVHLSSYYPACLSDYSFINPPSLPCSKLASEIHPSMLATVQSNTFCLLVCCLNTSKSEYTKLYFSLWFCMGLKLGL